MNDPDTRLPSPDDSRPEVSKIDPIVFGLFEWTMLIALILLGALCFYVLFADMAQRYWGP